MVQSLTVVGRQLAFKTLLSQLVVIALLTVVIALSTKGANAWAALLGGLAAIVPNALFGIIAFLHAGARANQKVVKSFFVGEGVKLLLTTVLVSLLFLLTDFNPMWLMSGFVVAVISQWIAPILFLKST